MKISYSFGILDLLHYGHINALTKAKNHSDLHIFGLLSDQASIEWVGTLVSNYWERKSVLETIGLVDKIMYQETLDPLDNIKALHEKYPEATITLYHGNNWKLYSAEDFLNSIGGRVIFTDYYKKLSPENIVEKLNNRITKKVNKNPIISTKASTLKNIQTYLTQSKIEKLYILKTTDWQSNKDALIESIQSYFEDGNVVIRSSSKNEDAFEQSNAGHYTSVLDVNVQSKSELSEAIDSVAASYGDAAQSIEEEQILIQEQTNHVDVSGVLFTRDIHMNRPYYLINYDDNGSTDAVTSGVGGKTLWIAHDTSKITGKWLSLINAVKEIEAILGDMVLDIEFAIKKDGNVVVFQIRPLAANARFMSINNDDTFYSEKEKALNNYSKLYNTFNNKPMFLSDMAFWNPSEIIGDNPRHLDYSLYREIITKEAWNSGLVPMGYRQVKNDLMYKIGNKPYISVDYSFLSLIPEQLSEALTKKLSDFYLKRFKSDLSAHDKIEFEIVYSLYDFSIFQNLDTLGDEEFYPKEVEEIKNTLKDMTESSMSNYFDFLREDTESLSILEAKRDHIYKEAQFNDNTPKLLDYIKMLLANIKTLATPQFSRQARYAFMARSFLETLVQNNYIDKNAMNAFMFSIETVATQFEKDFSSYLAGDLSKDIFHDRYGHLRSGTYDIRTDRYDQLSFKTGGELPQKSQKNVSSVSLDTEVMNKALHDIDLDISPEYFIDFLKSALEQREYFKFEFTKSLSLVLELIRKVGVNLGINRTDLSYLEVSDILAADYYLENGGLFEFWTALIESRKREYDGRSMLTLPEVICDAKDIDIVHFEESRPNFITNKSIDAEAVLLENDPNQDITNKIVVITKADPGFDWIFTKNIKGLITKFGGVASHMAIRCAEFNIPAAIGCGEKIFNYVSSLNTITLDCDKEIIKETGQAL